MIYYGAVDHVRTILSGINKYSIEKDSYYKNACARFIPLSRSAVLFDLGKYANVESLANLNDGPFLGGNSVEPQMPYDTVWLEVDDEESQTEIAILCNGIPFECDLVLEIMMVLRYNSKFVLLPGTLRFGIKNLEVGERPLMYTMLGELIEDQNRSDLAEDVKTYLMSGAGVVNIFLKLMQCKNIAVQSHVPSKSQQKRRTTVKPLLTYHTLVIKPTSKSRSVPSSETSGTRHRVHLQRGHFKTFTAEKPLLGHGVGTYWWQPHVRGRGNGMVIKDYKVEVKP